MTINIWFSVTDFEGPRYNFGYIQWSKGSSCCLLWSLTVHPASSCWADHCDGPQGKGKGDETDEPWECGGYQECPTLHSKAFSGCQVCKLFAGLVKFLWTIMEYVFMCPCTVSPVSPLIYASSLIVWVTYHLGLFSCQNFGLWKSLKIQFVLLNSGIIFVQLRY